MKPRVSFVCASYNYGRFVVQAIESLLDQGFDALEVIVIDDASTDDTQTVLARFANHPRVRLVCHTQNQRHIRSYNEGLGLARGEFVGLLSADDFCLSNHAVSRAVAIFDEHPRVGMVYGAHSVVENGQVVKRVTPWAEDQIIAGLDEFRRLMWGNDILHSGTLLRRSVQDELGPYDERLTQSGDWDMWLRTAARYDIGYIAEPLFAYRIHGVNMQNKGIPPARQAEQNVLTLERGFAALPPNAPEDITGAREGALRHALLQTVSFDLFNGHRARACQGIAFALRRRPALIFNGELIRLVLRLGFMTMAGRERYRRLLTLREGPGHDRPATP